MFEIYSNVWSYIIYGVSKARMVWCRYRHIVDFDDAEAGILEIIHESGTPVLDGIEPVWTSDWQ